MKIHVLRWMDNVEILLLAVHAGNSASVIAAHHHGAEILYPLDAHSPHFTEAVSIMRDQANEAATSTKKKRKGGGPENLDSLEMDSVDKQLHAAVVSLASRIASDERTNLSTVSMVSSAFAMAACRLSATVRMQFGAECFPPCRKTINPSVFVENETCFSKRLKISLCVLSNRGFGRS
jgi:hypothetical protein